MINYRNPIVFIIVVYRNYQLFQSLKRHVTVCHAVEEVENDDPLAFELCPCCEEPVDSAHTVRIKLIQTSLGTNIA